VIGVQPAAFARMAAADLEAGLHKASAVISKPSLSGITIVGPERAVRSQMPLFEINAGFFGYRLHGRMKPPFSFMN
jgi:hypothetical protein